MAERRMFAKSVINSGRFLRMPATSRLLYYDLGMAADDDGIAEAFTVMRTTGATEDDLRVLVSKGFIKVLNDELVSYICDWSKNNLIKKDRYQKSIYKDLLVSINEDNITIEEWNSNGTLMEPQDSIGKDSIGKDSIGKDSIGKDSIGKDNTGLSKDNRCTDVQQIIDVWNELDDLGVPKIACINPGTDRYKHLKARLKQFGQDNVIDAIDRIKRSDFLIGRINSFRITFDWFIKPNNFQKVLEGNYDTKNISQQSSFRNENEWIDEAIEAERRKNDDQSGVVFDSKGS